MKSFDERLLEHMQEEERRFLAEIQDDSDDEPWKKMGTLAFFWNTVKRRERCVRINIKCALVTAYAKFTKWCRGG